MNDRRHAVLVAGATGLVGSHLLEQLEASQDYSRVYTLGRRAPALQSPRVEHLTGDLGTPAGLWPDEVDTFFCCLGTTIRTAGSRAAFREVDLSLVVRLAQTARASGTDTGIVVSSVGADSASGNFYLRTKGEMEAALAETGFDRLGILRPSMLLGRREELRPAELAGKFVTRLVNPLMAGPLAKYRGVDAAVVAAAMIGLDQSAFTGQRIVQGTEIGQLAG